MKPLHAPVCKLSLASIAFVLLGLLFPHSLQAQIDKQILTFSFATIPGAVGTIDQNNYTVDVTVPNSQNLTAMVATFTLSPSAVVFVGAVQQVSSITPNNFTGTVVYRVVAPNASTRNFYVTVSKAQARTEKSLAEFKFLAVTPPAIGTINETAKTIALTVPYATSLTNLVATFTNSYLSTVLVAGQVQTSRTTPNNFTNPVVYTVMAEDGSTQNYTVTVTKASASSLCAMTEFRFTNIIPVITGTIVEGSAGANGVITLTIPFTGASKSNLIATFVYSEFSTVTVNNAAQVSGVTVNNFTSDLTYRIVAQDGTVKNYIVHVNQSAPSKENQILTFLFETSHNPQLTLNATGTINHTNKTISVTVPLQAIPGSMIPTFTSSLFSTVKVAGVTQVSGVTANNFNSPVSYKCISEESSEEIYIVTVVKAASTEKQLLSFSFQAFVPAVIGVINETAKTVAVTVPFGTDRTTLVATFTASSNTIVMVGAITQTSGVTPNDFTNPRTYTVIAENASTQDYTVTVSFGAASNQCAITEFKFMALNPQAVGIIDQVAGTIILTLPYSTQARQNLVATFTKSTFSNVTIGGTPQVSGVTPNNFTSDITYRVTAQDGITIKDYLVHVNFWSFNPADFVNDGEIVAQVLINQVAVVAPGGATGQLGAFVGSECRGVVTGGVTVGSKYVYTLRVYSNIGSGETMTFKYYDPGTDRILTVAETVPFVSNMTVGTQVNPAVFNTFTQTTLIRAMAAGWNWFSINVSTSDMTLNSRLALLAPQDGDYIKDQTKSATFNGSSGTWLGSLTTLDPKTMYKLKLKNAGVLTISGQPVDPSANPIAISAGWNWIGCIPQTSQAISSALMSIAPMENDYIKGQTSTATYFTSLGWFGVLTAIQPLQGYMLKSGKAATLIYSSGEPLKTKNIGASVPIEANANPENRELVVSGFEYSSQVTAQVLIDGSIRSDGELIAFVDSEMRGMAQSLEYPITGEALFIPMIYSNTAEGETVRFRFHERTTGEWYEFGETVRFKADMVESDASSPFRLQLARKISNAAASLENPSILVFPNPMKDRGTIQLDAQAESWSLTLYDLFGHVVREWYSGTDGNETAQLTIATAGLSCGVYHIRLVTPKTRISQTIVIAE